MGVNEPEEDVDMDQLIVQSVELGVRWAIKNNLQDIVTSMDVVRTKPEVIKLAVDSGIEAFSWGTVPGDVEWEKKQAEMGMRGLIYDLVMRMDRKK